MTIRKAEPRRRGPAPMDDATRLRLASCYALLARAAIDLAVKAKGSAKLMRALEDVVAARDAIADVALPMEHVAGESLDHMDVRRVVLEALSAGRVNWDHWRERERRKRAGLDPASGRPQA